MPLFMIENVVLFKKLTEDLKIWKGSLQARLKSRGIQWYTSEQRYPQTHFCWLSPHISPSSYVIEKARGL